MEGWRDGKVERRRGGEVEEQRNAASEVISSDKRGIKGKDKDRSVGD